MYVHPNPATTARWSVTGLTPRTEVSVRLRSLDGATVAPVLALHTDASGRAVVDFDAAVAVGVYLLEFTGGTRQVLRVAVH